MIIKNKKFLINTKGYLDFVDITRRVVSFVRRAGVKNGLVTIFSSHTTAGMRINENEPFLLRDMKNFLEKLSPKNGFYYHNSSGCPNGHSHC